MPDEPPWGYAEYSAEEQARHDRHAAAASDRYRNVPARSPEMRAEYDLQEEVERQIAAAEEEHIHFYGRYPTDPYVEHGEYCLGSCPYDTPERARERGAAEARANEPEAGL